MTIFGIPIKNKNQFKPTKTNGRIFKYQRKLKGGGIEAYILADEGLRPIRIVTAPKNNNFNKIMKKIYRIKKLLISSIRFN